MQIIIGPLFVKILQLKKDSGLMFNMECVSERLINVAEPRLGP